MNKTKWTLALLFIIFGLLLAACGGGIFPMQSSAGEAAKVTKVELVKLEGNPPEYHAVVTGQLPDGCTEIGRTTQRVVGRTIQITMNTTRSDDAVCTKAVQPFEETVRLDVDGLSAGQYSVEVNGVTTTFNLMEDH